jgi:thiamine-monophosphate kinase
MKFSSLGEKRVLEDLRSFLPIGDDGYVLPYGGKYLVLSSDMIYRPTHILDEMSWAQIGRHIVAINFSDIAAMGAKPLAFLLAVCSPDLEEEDFLELARAADALCKRFGVVYAGGDLNEADELSLAGFALGETDKPVYKRGAHVGDLVCVTGTLGGAALGVEILVKRLSEEWDNKDLQKILEHTLDAKPRVDEGYFLRNHATSMTDVSDSLAVSLHDIARESNVRLKIELEKIPLPDEGVRLANSLKLDLLECALYGGGDYELAFTLPEECWGTVRKKIDASVIGKVVAGEGVSSYRGNIDNRGFEHFTRK